MVNFIALFVNTMNFGDNVRKVREAKGLTQKEVAISCKMDPAQYSRIEHNKTDPSLSTIVKIAKAIGVSVAEIFSADELLKDVNSVDKSLMEKMALIDQLDKKERVAFFVMLDALVAKKKLKDNLSNVLQLAQ